MNVMKTLFLAITLLITATIYAAASTDMTPEQAVKILQTSNDLNELAAALKVAAANASTRQAVIEFLNQPSEVERIQQQFAIDSLHLTPEQIKDQEFMKQWGEEHPDEAKKANDDWQSLKQSTCSSLQVFFAQSNDTAMFQIFRNFETNTVLKGVWEGSYDFVKALPHDSPLIPLYLDSLDIEAQPNSKQQNYLPLLEAMANVNTDEAYARIRNGILSGKYPQSDIVTLLDYRLIDHRYDPGVFSLFEAGFMAFGDQGKADLISAFFAEWMREGNQGTPDASVPKRGKISPDV